ncbi:hypothetical protein CEXT_559211 [Caerostris extrusa]|uniref:Uncharacterized protein n=1 Tax=Caerostris extrusa TaxID=172846 RepID=A0AAV4NYF9_CAEEX|nr:hypothetical protein CEXT_559211 [Caerostris extrusa]
MTPSNRNSLAKVRRHKANAFISNFRAWYLGKGVVVGKGGWRWNDLHITCSADETDRVLSCSVSSASLSVANGILESVEFCLDFSSLHEILLTLKDRIVTYAHILETEGASLKIREYERGVWARLKFLIEIV